MVTKRVVWPHEEVYTMHGQPPVYSDMSLAWFVNGYLTVLAEEDEDKKSILLQHLQELMEAGNQFDATTLLGLVAAD